MALPCGSGSHPPTTSSRADASSNGHIPHMMFNKVSLAPELRRFINQKFEGDHNAFQLNRLQLNLKSY